VGVRVRVIFVCVVGAALAVTSAGARPVATPGVSATEIHLGSSVPLSGEAAVAGNVARGIDAYFKYVNDQGGVLGRKLTFTYLDDGYDPGRAVNNTIRLIQQEQVLAVFSSLGTSNNLAVRKLLNDSKVPQLFVSSGATTFGRDYKKYPWTIGYIPPYSEEGALYGRYVVKNIKKPKIAVLYQNDDYGKDYLSGLKDGLGDRYAKMVVAQASYEVTDPTVDSQIVTLQASGADVFVDIAGPKFAAQAIRKVHAIGWQPLHFLNTVGSAVGAVLQPAGLENSVGIITSRYYKDPSDPQWADDAGYREWLAWMKKYNPDGNVADYYNVLGYNIAMTLVHVLKQCGDDLGRENIMRQAADIHGLELPMLLPGVVVNTTAADYRPIRQMRLVQFDGQTWKSISDLIDDEM
jgi:branched-chain amino acid transport system substrate-binding protein